MRGSIVIALVVLGLGTAGAGGAMDDARKLVETAGISYKLGNFDAALADYTKAYALFPVPALLFNIGQCHRELKNYERAVFFYQGYLRESPPNSADRTVVEGLLHDMQAALDRQRAELAAHAAAVAEEGRRREDAARRAEADRQLEARERKRREGDKLYRKWWFWSAIGGAVAIGGTAYYFSGDTTYIAPTGTLGGLDRR